MIEVADLLSGILRHWDDVIIVSILLVFNAAVGFWQEHTAADAVAALKRQLALGATVRRDGRWSKIDASELVPGDLVRLRLGDIIPADVFLAEGDYLRLDQSALTGESLPVDKQHGDLAYSESIAIQGERTALVTATGERTYFGKTTRLVAQAKPVSHFQKAVLTIGDYLIFLSIALVMVLVLVELFRGAKILTLIQFALILTVAAIPVAMPAVLSVTMAVGAVALSKMKAVVTRLESIEEMAGIDVLCSDKTGTLTENKLQLGDPVVIEAENPAEVILAGALASQFETGDAIDKAVIAAEIAERIGLGRNIVPAREILYDDPEKDLSSAQVARIEEADGFVEVFPEHKYAIVKALQGKGHLVGMTGDGVNDAPALKQADTGVAVSGATDAARAAAALVLTAPGLSVIVSAIEQARRVFEQMNLYAIYRVTETIRIVLFVVAAMIGFNLYPITAILIILLALFNDAPIMTIAIDNTSVDPKPVRWDMRRVLAVSTTLGTIGVFETFLILVLAKLWLHLDVAQIQSFIFLKLAIAGHLTLFVARARGPFLARPWPAASMLWAAIGTKVLATLLVGFGFGLIAPIGWAEIGLVWGYCLVWVFVEDWAKLAVYRHLDLSGHHHQRFIQRAQERLHV